MRHPKQLILGVCGSVVLLVVFFIMQSRNGPLVEIPKYLLLFSLAPVAIGLVAGGYVTRFKTKWIELESLPEAPQTQASAPLKAGTGDWRLQHSEEYGRTHHYMLAHVYRPSTEPGQAFDIFIFVVRHEKGTDRPPKTKFTEIEIRKADFFFGESWGNQVFAVPNTGGIIGVRTHAWGTFLATCKVTLTEHEPVVLHRYIDFFMDAPYARRALGPQAHAPGSTDPQPR